MEILIFILFGIILPFTLCPINTVTFILISFTIYFVFVLIEILVEYKKESLYNKSVDSNK